MKNLIPQLIEQGYLKTPRIIKAFKKVDRANFMLPENREYAGVNTPFPIGQGQTISQPLTVAFMLEKLEPQLGDKVLDIGFGSGWTVALLAEIVGPQGKVIGLEIVPDVCRFGKANVERAQYQNVELIEGDGSGGWAKGGPYQKIIGAAAAPEVPPPLKKQLAIGGRLVLPVRDLIVVLDKIAENKFREKQYPYFAFVPMRGKYGYKEFRL